MRASRDMVTVPCDSIVDLRGIEPPSAGCKPAALPLSYKPMTAHERHQQRSWPAAPLIMPKDVHNMV